MMKDEFMQKAGLEWLADEDYDKIEAVYLNTPGIRDVSAMAAVFRTHGMPVIDLLYPLALAFRTSEERCDRLMDENDVLKSIIRHALHVLEEASE